MVDQGDDFTDQVRHQKIVIAPLTASQYEIGVKYRPSQERLLVTAAAFQGRQRLAQTRCNGEEGPVI